ncbi:MAG: 50S ribosomal protein L33 [Bacilli bacterium]|nr:50S ribosomal protein L33 [Bacilli bacterium]
MAKNENRVYVEIKCSECGVMTRRPISKNKKNTTDKIEINKYCPRCNKHTVFKEKK